LAAVRSFAVQQNPSHTSSSHWWYQKDYDMAHSLDETGRQSFKRIAGGNQMIQMFYDHFDPKYYTTECVDGMNEVRHSLLSPAGGGLCTDPHLQSV
jgi:hypothetical protein